MYFGMHSVETLFSAESACQIVFGLLALCLISNMAL